MKYYKSFNSWRAATIFRGAGTRGHPRIVSLATVAKRRRLGGVSAALWGSP
jgi:hypothetical protein